MLKNRLLKTKGRHIPNRGCVSQTETSVYQCVYTHAHITGYQLLPFSVNFILNLSPMKKKLLKNECFPVRRLKKELEVYSRASKLVLIHCLEYK